MTVHTPIPHLRKLERGWELVVDDRPYLILGAELHNSSLSCARYMDTVWHRLKAMNVNTVLGSVTWEDVEVKEGVFDFSELDKIIAAAKSYGLRLVLLWFGSFKNAFSNYVPGWVKQDPKRFPRMRVRRANGRVDPVEAISIFHDECVQADARAFARFMQHLAEVDRDRTVVMVQVENEVGLFGDSKDRSSFASQIFEAPVPTELVQLLATRSETMHQDPKKNLTAYLARAMSSGAAEPSGNWEACFGQSVYTDELFMAYHYARYVDQVAAAGKKAYRLPVFTNVWLPEPSTGGSSSNLVAAGGNLPGEYPSGGAVANVTDVWFHFAPTLDFISPDIYSADYTKTCQIYSRGNRPLFIPEQRRDEIGVRRLWEAMGTHLALGACPFGIDTIAPAVCAYTRHFALLASLRGVILKARQKGLQSFGFYFDEVDESMTDAAETKQVSFTGFDLFVSRASVMGGVPSPGYGMIIELEPAKYLLIGNGFRVVANSSSPTSDFSGILRFEEKSVVDADEGTLRTERVLNGDETRSGKWANMPSDDPDYGESFIPILIPSRTMIAELNVYSLEEQDMVK